MTQEQIELKVVEYAKSVNWDFRKVVQEIRDRYEIVDFNEWNDLDGSTSFDKVNYIFNKYKPKTKEQLLQEIVNNRVEHNSMCYHPTLTQEQIKQKEEMKTKVTVLGDEPKEKELKPIEFVCSVRANEIYRSRVSESQLPHTWDDIILLKKDYNQGGLDLMAASNKNGHNFCLFLGHFNDGIV